METGREETRNMKEHHAIPLPAAAILTGIGFETL
jgi:hypothetical protein